MTYRSVSLALVDNVYIGRASLLPPSGGTRRDRVASIRYYFNSLRRTAARVLWCIAVIQRFVVQRKLQIFENHKLKGTSNFIITQVINQIHCAKHFEWNTPGSTISFHV